MVSLPGGASFPSFSSLLPSPLFGGKFLVQWEDLTQPRCIRPGVP